jgi:hypothetical protein
MKFMAPRRVRGVGRGTEGCGGTYYEHIRPYGALKVRHQERKKKVMVFIN